MPKFLRNFIGFGVSLFVLFGPAFPAHSQSYEVVSYEKPFIPLAQLPYRNGPINYVTFGSSFSFVSQLPIGFNINFFGDQGDEFGVSPSGMVGFIPGTSFAFANTTLGSVLPPNGFIAPWWDDLNLASLNYGTSYAVFGTSPNRVLVIETQNFSANPNLNDGGHWQVWIYETPLTQNVRFAVQVSGEISNSYSASVGFEGVQGLLGVSFLSCSPNCDASDAAAELHGKAYTVLNVPGPELIGEINQSPRGILPGGSGTVEFTIRNIGTGSAQTISSKLYLSADNAFDNNDIMLGQTTTNSLGAGRFTRPSITITSPSSLTPGDYYLLLEVDDNQSVAQTFRIDDHVIGPQKLANAYDLEVSNVSSPSSGSPGDAFPVQFDLKQNGASYSGNVNVTLYASLDRNFDASDLQISAPANVSANGNAQQSLTVNGTLPMNLAPGQYHVLVLLDTLQQVTEYNEFNNRAVSSTVFNSGPDFSASSIQLPSTITPGSTAQVTTTITSNGVPYNGNVSYQLYASPDLQLNTTTDYALGNFQISFSGQTSRDGVETITVPNTIAPGSYFIIALIDPMLQIAETIESNNTFSSLTRFLTHTDLSVSNVIAPSSARPGDTISISFDMQALGQAVNNAVDYRIYLSSNPSLGGSDIPIHNDATALTNGTIASVTVDVVLPTTVLVRQWRILIEADPNNFIVESQETNNVSASLSTMLVTGADLVVMPPLIGSPFAFTGRDYRLRGDIDNLGVAEAADFRYAVYLSDNEVIGTADRRVFLSPLISITPGNRFSFDEQIPIPADIPVGRYYLGVIADILSVIPETSELNNSLYLGQTVQVTEPSPDLRGNILGAPPSTSPGETVNITRVLDNIGVQDANQVSYAYYLSSDAEVTKDDILLSRQQVTIPQGASDFGSDSFVIPNGILPGNYYLAGILDPDENVAETDETNNVFAAPQLQVFAPSLRFVNEQLPLAIVGLPYEAGIFVEGISGVAPLAVSNGQLPPGLAVDQATGSIKGTATVEGLYTFTLRANLTTSSYIEQVFSIRSALPTTGLSIASETIPVVLTQKPYSTQLLALGGIAPYKWTTTSSLPEGLNFSEEGVLSGTALITGQYSMEVSVSDDKGDQAMKTFGIYVLTPRQTVQIRQSDLPFGVVDQEYCELATVVLRAERGIEPYIWSLDNDAPPGLSLSEEGKLCGTPSTPGEYTLKVRVTDQTGVFDSTAFFIRISSGREFAVSTFALPYAILNQAYEGEITAVRGAEPYSFSVLNGKLPPGLELSTDGAIRGTATATGTYAFITQATDNRGRSRNQALSIIVYREAKASTDCSCSTSSTESSATASVLILLGLMILAIMRTRPRQTVRVQSKRPDRRH